MRRPLDARRPGPAAEREQAFRSLYEQHGAAVMTYLMRRCASGADVEDALAETFTVAWRRFDDIPGEDRSILWLYGVARRVLANQRRGQRRREQLAVRLSLARRESHLVEPEVREQLDTVLRALSRLDAKDREILLLAAWEGLTHAEIALVLGCSENASAIRLHRARQRLNRAYAKDAAASRKQGEASGRGDARRGRHGRPA